MSPCLDCGEPCDGPRCDEHIDCALHFSVGRTDFVTPDQVGWGMENSSGSNAYLRLRSWSLV